MDAREGRDAMAARCQARQRGPAMPGDAPCCLQTWRLNFRAEGDIDCWMSQPNNSFNDPLAIKNYAENAARRVPGLHDLQKMAALLVAERAPELANVLVVGAGGGMELNELAQTYPQWHFVGVDPSKPMLDLA